MAGSSWRAALVSWEPRRLPPLPTRRLWTDVLPLR